MDELFDGKIISPNCGKLQYTGRVDLENLDEPVFIWAGSSVKMRFTGKGVGVLIYNHKFFNRMYLGCVIDGKVKKVKIPKDEQEVFILLEDSLEPEKEHEVILFKRQDASHYFKLMGFAIDKNGEVLELPEPPKRKIECYGDSVSAGAVVEAMDCHGKIDPKDHEGRYDNAWYSFPMIIARNFNAQVYNCAQGGIAIFDNTGYYHDPDRIGMQTAYDKLYYFPESEKGYVKWDFSRYTPNLVIFAVGQNDNHYEWEDDIDIEDPEYRIKWKEEYKRIVKNLMERYPKAYFILTLTILGHDLEWDKAIEEIKDEINSERVMHFQFTRSGKATPGHPRVLEQYEMAEELTAYINSLGEQIWED